MENNILKEKTRFCHLRKEHIGKKARSQYILICILIEQYVGKIYLKYLKKIFTSDKIRQKSGLRSIWGDFIFGNITFWSFFSVSSCCLIKCDYK